MMNSPINIPMRYYNKCKCCLEEGPLKDMWSEYAHDGQIEMYGEMLSECFVLPWLIPSETMDSICQNCICRLREAFHFKKEILASQEVWNELELQESVLEEKDQGCENFEKKTFTYILETPEQDAEEDDCETSSKDIQLEKEEHNNEYGNSEKEVVLCTFEQEAWEQDTQGDNSEESYLNDESSQEWKEETQADDSNQEKVMLVEYLEDDIDAETEVRKKRRTPQNVYKQYSQSDLNLAIDMVMKQCMTRGEAALKYNIPLKTLGSKIRMKEMGDTCEGDLEEETDRMRRSKFYEEIRKILTYTNATPYKTKISKYICAYCSTEVNRVFRDAEALRVHTRTKHAHERLKKVEFFMRPSYLYEILKLDILNLHCTVCMLSLPDWNSMFQHLLDAHNETLDQAYTRVIPYILNDDLKCALCEKSFSHFHMLDCHMNAHYSNYMCGECGETFVTESRLKKHSETHSTDRIPCLDCGRIFTLEKYRKKHHEMVHKKSKRFKCEHCPERFVGEYNKHLHVVDAHQDKVKVIRCELCDRTFTWRPYYLKHKRLVHQKLEKKIKCKICDKKFHQKHELKNHLEWHKGEGYTCEICQKKFASKSYLQKHLSTHGESGGGVWVVVNDDEQGQIG